MFVQHLIQHHVHTEVCANPHMLCYQFAFVCCSYMLTLVPTIVATAADSFCIITANLMDPTLQLLHTRHSLPRPLPTGACCLWGIVSATQVAV